MPSTDVPGTDEVTVLFLRHGKARTSSERYEPDANCPLTPDGQAAAARAAAQIAAFGPDTLYTSPSLRARQTAEHVERATGLTAQPAPGLAERYFHSLVGLTRQQIVAAHGDRALHLLETGTESLELPGDESFDQARHRVITAFGSLLRRGGRRIAMVSHGGPHAWLLGHLQGVAPERQRLFRLTEAHFSLLTLVNPAEHLELRSIDALNSFSLPSRSLPAGSAHQVG